MKDWLVKLLYFNTLLQEPEDEEEVEEEEVEEEEETKKPSFSKKKKVTKPKKEDTVTLTKAQFDQLLAEVKNAREEVEEEIEEEEETKTTKKSSIDDNVISFLKKELDKNTKAMLKMQNDSKKREQRDEMLNYVKKLSKEKPYLADNLDSIVENGATSIDEIDKIIDVVEDYAKNEWERAKEAEKVTKKVEKANSLVDPTLNPSKEEEEIDKKEFKKLTDQEKEAYLSEKFLQDALSDFGLV